MVNMSQFLYDSLEARRNFKRDNPNPKLPTRDEKLLMELEMYSKAGSMGSKHTPLYSR